MNLLLSHWHCIIPAIAIIVAVFFLRGKPETKKEDSRNRTADKEMDGNHLKLQFELIKNPIGKG
jgi:hypothetical protein